MTVGPLTPKQQHVLARLRDEPEETLTLGQLAARAGVKVDVMRRMIERLMERRMVKSRGRGAAREVALTVRGRNAIGDRDPAPVSAGASDREYQVLQERNLLELFAEIASLGAVGDLEMYGVEVEDWQDVQVFIPLGQPVAARNNEDAYRKAVRDSDGLPEEPILAAVSTRYWQPVPVNVHTRHVVSVG